MCLTPCSVATEFSIFRATSVSSCAGEAPGNDADTITVGRSMSGKFWIFIDLKLIRPTSVSMMNKSIDGIGLRMHQAETFIAIPLFARCRRGGAGRLDGGLGRRRIGHAHGVAVREEATARRDDARRSIESGGDLHPVADTASDA